MIRQWFLDLIPWGTKAIQEVQRVGHPALDVFFQAVTWLGNETGYLVVFPILFWCIDVRIGRRIGFLLFASLYLNAMAKAYFAIPRPDPTAVRMVVTEASFSWPSGHAQGSMTLWGYLAWSWRSWPLRLAVLLAFPLMGFSRLYLGVHFPQDILGGWLLALLLLAVGIALEAPIHAFLGRFPLLPQILFASLPPLLVFLAWPDRRFARIAGLLIGFGLGTTLERATLGFETGGSFLQRSLRLLGLLPLIGLWLGLKFLLPEGKFFSLLRYALVGLAGSYLLPLAFVRLRWASSSLVSQKASTSEVPA